MRILLFFSTVLLVACQPKKVTPVDPEPPAAFELTHGITGDTVNLTDANGMRQGKWVPAPTNELTATVVYKDDSIIKVLEVMNTTNAE